MNVGSVFSGIGGFDLGLERAGHRVLWQCEIDPYRRRVLERHWPGVPCWEDIVHLRESAQRGSADGLRAPADDGRREAGAGLPSGVDLLCGGFPCQDLSVAGDRAGLAGERSGLFFEFARVADHVLPAGGWVLIENVPGLFSSHDGRDFAVLLATLAELGFHDLAWRVLDSRYLGVPQRRRRVYILGRRARGRGAAAVLLEPESGGGDFAASREARTGLAGSPADGAEAARSVTRRVGARLDGETEDFLAGRSYYIEDFENGTLTAEEGRTDRRPLVAGTLGAEKHRYDLDSSGAYVAVDGEAPDADGVRAPSGLPGRLDGEPVRAFSIVPEGGQGADLRATEVDTSPALTELQNRAKTERGVRIVGNGEPTDRCAVDPLPDGPRYAACGDAVTVNAAEWIGRRLEQHGQ